MEAIYKFLNFNCFIGDYLNWNLAMEITTKNKTAVRTIQSNAVE